MIPMLRKMLSIALALALAGCTPGQTTKNTEEASAMNRQIEIQIDGRAMTATLEDNSSADALLELLAQGPMVVDMHDYGSFEKVGSLPKRLPENNRQITTAPGDIILYQGNSITIYYDVNSWNFTRLGRVDGADGETMRDFLGDGDPTVTFSLPEGEK